MLHFSVHRGSETFNPWSFIEKEIKGPDCFGVSPSQITKYITIYHD